MQRGGCYFSDKARYVQQAGARAVIIYSDVKVRFAASRPPCRRSGPPCSAPPCPTFPFHEIVFPPQYFAVHAVHTLANTLPIPQDNGYFSMSPPSDYVPGSLSVAVGSVPLSTGLWLKSSVAAGEWVGAAGSDLERGWKG